MHGLVALAHTVYAALGALHSDPRFPTLDLASPSATAPHRLQLSSSPTDCIPTEPLHRRLRDRERTMAHALPHIPLAYRLLLLYVEPVMAFNGALLLLFKPDVFLNTFSPDLRSSPDSQIVYDQLGATYILFAFNQAIVLRVARDLRVWKAIVLGILICDAVHFWAGWKVMIQDGNTNPIGWRPEDWVAVLSLIIPGSLRLAFLLGVGIKPNTGGEKGASKR